MELGNTVLTRRACGVVSAGKFWRRRRIFLVYVDSVLIG